MSTNRKSFKSGDLVYMDRPDCEWILKIESADDSTQSFTFTNAVVRVKPPAPPDIEDSDDFGDMEDDNTDEDNDSSIKELDDDDFSDLIPIWKPLLEAVPAEYRAKKEKFSYDYITSYANVDHFDTYMTVLGNWTSSFFDDHNHRRNAPRRQAQSS